MQVLVPGSGRGYVDGDSLDHRAPLAATIVDVLSAEQCVALIARFEAEGYIDAPISLRSGEVRRPDIRNNQRTMFDDPALAASLFTVIAPHVPATLADRNLVGLNERFRGYRYQPGQRFAPHYDGAFVRNPDEASQLTLLFYLDEGCVGGDTVFLHYDRAMTPRRGAALWFQHHLLHEGAEVRGGHKHVLRTDVMYRAA